MSLTCDENLRKRIHLYAPVNVDALLDRACFVRGCHYKCSLGGLIIGSESIIITLKFEDGLEWISKLPWKQHHLGNSPPEPLKIESEVVTMKFVGENTRIPVPEIFDYSVHCETYVGWAYIFMSKAPGMSLESLEWSELTIVQQSKVMRELANVLYQLSTLRFNQIGSLVMLNSNYTIVRCIRRSFQSPYNLTELKIDSGPFDSSENYYRSLLSRYHADISNRKSTSRFPFLYPLPLRRNYSTEEEFRSAEAEYNDSAYLSKEYSSTEVNIDQYKRLCAELEISLPQMVDFNRRTFLLEHPDLNHSNIFVSDDLTISCIIDWEYASIVPWETFCIPPHLPGRRDPLRVELQNDFEDVIRDLETLDNTLPRIFCASSGQLVPTNNDEGASFSELLSRSEPMWAYDRLVQNETWIEFHPIVDEFLSWKLGSDWKSKFVKHDGTPL